MYLFALFGHKILWTLRHVRCTLNHDAAHEADKCLNKIVEGRTDMLLVDLIVSVAPNTAYAHVSYDPGGVQDHM